MYVPITPCHCPGTPVFLQLKACTETITLCHCTGTIVKESIFVKSKICTAPPLPHSISLDTLSQDTRAVSVLQPNVWAGPHYPVSLHWSHCPMSSAVTTQGMHWYYYPPVISRKLLSWDSSVVTTLGMHWPPYPMSLHGYHCPGTAVLLRPKVKSSRQRPVVFSGTVSLLLCF